MKRSSTFSPLRIARYVTLVVTIFISFSLLTHESEKIQPQENGSHESEVTIAITHDSPPFYTLNGDGGSEWRMIETALGEIGHHTSRPLYIPFPQALDLYERGLVSAIWLGRPDQKQESEDWHISDPLLTREFVAITLAKSGLVLTTPDDLAGMDVGCVSRVEEVLGDMLQPTTGTDPAYQACKSDTLMLLMLYDNRLEAAISDQSTFEYNREKLPLSIYKGKPVTYHKIFPPVYPRLVFSDATLRDEFNAALKRIRNNGMIHTDSSEREMISPSETKH